MLRSALGIQSAKNHRERKPATTIVNLLIGAS